MTDINEIKGLLSQGLNYHQAGDLKAARAVYHHLVQSFPGHAGAWHLLGMVNHQEGLLAEATEQMKRAVALRPEIPEYRESLALVFQDAGELEKAVTVLKGALELRPDAEDYHNQLGLAYQRMGRFSEARHHYAAALKINPGFAQAYNNMGYVLTEQQQWGQAVGYLEKAISLQPSAEAYGNLGMAYKAQFRLPEAEKCYEKAISLNPDYAEAWNNLGNLCRETRRQQDAIQCYQKAVHIKNDFSGACCNLVHQLQELCSWQSLPSLGDHLARLTREELDRGIRPGETPFVSLTRQMDPAVNLSVARGWSRSVQRRIADSPARFSSFDWQLDQEKIVLGYLSGDFRDHPVAHLIWQLFARHDRERFQVTCFAFGEDDHSNARQRIRSHCDMFIDLDALGVSEAVRCIHDQKVHILVDLMGYTKDNRIDIVACRPAPIQVAYLGFPGTTGGDFLDYFITDAVASPEDAADHFSENLVYLPHCYQINAYDAAEKGPVVTRKEAGLPEDAVVFCSFNQAYKLDEPMFEIWMYILRDTPGSVLWLTGYSPLVQDNLRSFAVKKGVAPQRLVFAERVPSRPAHLSRLSLADIALDTRIYNGHTTTSDALWAGVPVVSLMGGHFASRASASMLTAIGLPELIAQSIPEYQAKVLELARDPVLLKTLRDKLAANRSRMPLFDTRQFVHHLEVAYNEMWEIYRAGQAPRPIVVPEKAY